MSQTENPVAVRENTPNSPSEGDKELEKNRSPKREERSSSPRRRKSPSREGGGGGSSGGGTNKGNTLYVSGLASKTRDSDLESRFGKYGKVLDCKLITDPRTGDSRGFAFIQMENVKEAEDCIYYLDRTEFDGRLITVEK